MDSYEVSKNYKIAQSRLGANKTRVNKPTTAISNKNETVKKTNVSDKSPHFLKHAPRKCSNQATRKSKSNLERNDLSFDRFTSKEELNPPPHNDVLQTLSPRCTNIVSERDSGSGDLAWIATRRLEDSSCDGKFTTYIHGQMQNSVLPIENDTAKKKTYSTKKEKGKTNLVSFYKYNNLMTKNDHIRNEDCNINDTTCSENYVVRYDLSSHTWKKLVNKKYSLMHENGRVSSRISKRSSARRDDTLMCKLSKENMQNRSRSTCRGRSRSGVHIHRRANIKCNKGSANCFAISHHVCEDDPVEYGNTGSPLVSCFSKGRFRGKEVRGGVHNGTPSSHVNPIRMIPLNVHEHTVNWKKNNEFNKIAKFSVKVVSGDLDNMQRSIDVKKGDVTTRYTCGDSHSMDCHSGDCAGRHREKHLSCCSYISTVHHDEDTEYLFNIPDKDKHRQKHLTKSNAQPMADLTKKRMIRISEKKKIKERQNINVSNEMIENRECCNQDTGKNYIQWSKITSSHFLSPVNDLRISGEDILNGCKMTDRICSNIILKRYINKKVTSDSVLYSDVNSLIKKLHIKKKNKSSAYFKYYMNKYDEEKRKNTKVGVKTVRSLEEGAHIWDSHFNKWKQKRGKEKIIKLTNGSYSTNFDNLHDLGRKSVIGCRARGIIGHFNHGTKSELVADETHGHGQPAIGSGVRGSVGGRTQLHRSQTYLFPCPKGDNIGRIQRISKGDPFYPTALKKNRSFEETIETTINRNRDSSDDCGNHSIPNRDRDRDYTLCECNAGSCTVTNIFHNDLIEKGHLHRCRSNIWKNRQAHYGKKGTKKYSSVHEYSDSLTNYNPRYDSFQLSSINNKRVFKKLMRKKMKRMAKKYIHNINNKDDQVAKEKCKGISNRMDCHNNSDNNHRVCDGHVTEESCDYQHLHLPMRRVRYSRKGFNHIERVTALQKCSEGKIMESRSRVKRKIVSCDMYPKEERRVCVVRRGQLHNLLRCTSTTGKLPRELSHELRIKCHIIKGKRKQGEKRRGGRSRLEKKRSALLKLRYSQESSQCRGGNSASADGNGDNLDLIWCKGKNEEKAFSEPCHGNSANVYSANTIQKSNLNGHLKVVPPMDVLHLYSAHRIDEQVHVENEHMKNYTTLSISCQEGEKTPLKSNKRWEDGEKEICCKENAFCDDRMNIRKSEEVCTKGGCISRGGLIKGRKKVGEKAGGTRRKKKKGVRKKKRLFLSGENGEVCKKTRKNALKMFNEKSECRGRESGCGKSGCGRSDCGVSDCGKSSCDYYDLAYSNNVFGAVSENCRTHNDMYYIVGLVYYGEKSQVYKCVNIHNKKTYAMKVVLKEDNDLQVDAFLKKYIFLKKHPHKHIVTIYDIFTDNNYNCVIMTFCEGSTLFDYFMSLVPGSLKIYDIKKIMKKLFLALHFLHSKNIIHRDIKLENIMFARKKRGNLGYEQFGGCSESEEWMYDHTNEWTSHWGRTRRKAARVARRNVYRKRGCCSPPFPLSFLAKRGNVQERDNDKGLLRRDCRCARKGSPSSCCEKEDPREVETKSDKSYGHRYDPGYYDPSCGPSSGQSCLPTWERDSFCVSPNEAVSVSSFYSHLDYEESSCTPSDSDYAFSLVSNGDKMWKREFMNKRNCNKLFSNLRKGSLTGIQMREGKYGIIRAEKKKQNEKKKRKKNRRENSYSYNDLCLIDMDMMETVSSNKSNVGGRSHIICGTAPYMSPESLDGILSTSNDIWACGVILYALMDGRFPFEINNNMPVYLKKKILTHTKPNFDPFVWQEYPEVLDLCLRLLDPNHLTRIQNAREALIHYCFADVA
ncbi:serine/threonine protein kinase, putative [Plasmodium ovale wallikeri]|uniref:Serine/threonine protein kinase, putative n=1 Tax=Plasmodium ovale wallikeri TaxID=864142 RepID=A0A1A8YKS4_PLAOA|nr:serine/threonine protein kinase, putative [Plasmodium ovale wallikeri]